MRLQAHDATVPFGNFWKAVIFGIINLEFFFFFFLTAGSGKECNNVINICHAMEIFRSGFFFFGLVWF